jgi:hypothetical protein
MVMEDANTIINKLKSSNTFKALFSGERMKIADKYCAKIITGML